jgi:hypothetical protein
MSGLPCLFVLQKLGVLDTALAQPSGRHMLQALPPDVLAAILSYDTLAATSENTVLAAGRCKCSHMMDVLVLPALLPTGRHNCQVGAHLLTHG